MDQNQLVEKDRKFSRNRKTFQEVTVNKRVVIFVVLVAAMVLSAVSAWPATLSVYNGTGDNVYIKLSKYGVMKYFLTATVEGNSADRYWSIFDITRKTYSAVVTACDTTTTSGAMDLRTNLRLVFTGCDSMKQWWTPKYWGEPSMEKVNFYNNGTDFEWAPPDDGWYGSGWFKGDGGHAFYFQYSVLP
jgi:hypothetical protein